MVNDRDDISLRKLMASAAVPVIFVGAFLAFPSTLVGMIKVFIPSFGESIASWIIAFLITVILAMGAGLGAIFRLYRDYRDRFANEKLNSNAGYHVFANRDDKTYKALLAGALREAASINVVGISNDRFCDDSDTDDLFAFLTRPQCSLKLVFLDPESIASIERGKAESWAKDDFLSIRTSLNLIKLGRMLDTDHRSNNQVKDRVKVRLYNHAPDAALIIIDDRKVFVNYYHLKSRGNQSPAFYFDAKEQPQVVSHYKSEFDLVWERATEWRFPTS